MDAKEAPDPTEDTVGGPPTAQPPDYLLVVGPGRSGSTFLYRLANRHAAFSAPRIKEGCYYRSPGRFEKALREIQKNTSSILLDVANLAWRDPALSGGVKALMNRGYRVLLVVLLRDHLDRAISMARHRRSRGIPSALLGRRVLEHALVRDSLTPEDLSGIFSLGPDVLVVGFKALTGNTVETLDSLACLCGTEGFDATDPAPANPTLRAHNMLLSALGKLAATALRGARCYRLLQRLKDSPRITRLFFRPTDGGDWPRFDKKTENLFADLSTACQHTVQQAGEPLAEDLWLVRTGMMTDTVGQPGSRPAD